MIDGSCHCGAVRWQFEGQPEGATACNCTVCRRHGVLWAYDYDGQGIKVSGKTRPYVRGKGIEFHFCAVCGCVAFWRAPQKDQEGRRRIAVNLRFAEPEAVARIRIDHFDTRPLRPEKDVTRSRHCRRSSCRISSPGRAMSQ